MHLRNPTFIPIYLHVERFCCFAISLDHIFSVQGIEGLYIFVLLVAGGPWPISVRTHRFEGASIDKLDVFLVCGLYLFPNILAEWGGVGSICGEIWLDPIFPLIS